MTLVLQATPSPRLLPLTPAVALVLKTHELVWAEVRNPELPGFADICTGTPHEDHLELQSLPVFWLRGKIPELGSSNQEPGIIT